MALENLVNLQGCLAETAQRLGTSTIQRAAQIMKDRKDDESLGNRWFRTADSALYRVERGSEILYLGGIETNLIFRNLSEATGQLLQTQNYKPGKKDIKSVVDAAKQGTALRVKLSDLELQTHDDESCYYEIDTTNYDNSVKEGGLNKKQREVAERVYGEGADFDKSMNILSFDKSMNIFRTAEPKNSKTRVWVLNPKYVRENVGENNGLARACRLYTVDYDSSFDASGRVVGSSLDWLRGVPVKVAEGGDAFEYFPAEYWRYT